VADTPVHAIRAPLSAFDTWEIEEQLRHVDRILSGARFATEVQRPAHADLAHGPRASLAMQAKLAAAAETAARPRRTRFRLRIAWTIVAAGAAALAVGLALLAAGAIVGRSGWMSFGLPMTLLGQVALLLGMMMQLDLVWRGKRETASKLYRFQKRLLDLEALAAELAPESNEEPAPPEDEQELMTELKTRLDLLSHRLNVPCG
jgi:hypothetical protein